jgi:hypothetical protein
MLTEDRGRASIVSQPRRQETDAIWPATTESSLFAKWQ